jgi:shikimate dehydrogenase
VVGSPIGHSLSPVLHRAAYQALGLTGWSYGRAEVRAGELAAYVAALPTGWVGLSVTMPGKEEALALAAVAGDEARLTGAANTLVRTDAGWRADNTDVAGLAAALSEAGAVGRTALVVGSGATARSALVALHRCGVTEVVLQVRRTARVDTLALADTLGLTVRTLRYGGPAPDAADLDLAVSTVPAGGGPAPLPTGDVAGLVALDVVYDPWPTAWAGELARRGARVVSGESMLLHQAARQVQLMTGLPAPLEAMRRALAQVREAATPVVEA